MDCRLETYKIWAPPHVFWSQWAKPVLFAGASFGRETIPSLTVLSGVPWLSVVDPRTAIIVDLPNKMGVEEGLAIAGLGYRPVPLYNGVDGPSPAVNVHSIAAALWGGADMLRGLSIRADAPPVFLLDADRMKGTGKKPGTYDNRWCVFAQDMPSAACLLERGIDRVIVRSPVVQTDLEHVLRRYQDKGIKLSLCNGRDVNPITVTKLFQFGSLLYRAKVISGLTRNAAGGFGGKIPYPSEGGGVYFGGGYHGFG